MGTKSRRASRRSRHERESTPSGLTVTVGVTPTTDSRGQVSLQNEIRLVRSSLLYADRVELVAPGACWVWTLAPIRGLDPDDAWNTVAELPPETLQRMGVEGVPLRAFRREMRNFAKLSKTDPRRVEGEGLWRPAMLQMMQEADAVFGGADAPELELALKTGDVQLISGGIQLEDDTEQQIAGFRDHIAQALADPSRTVLLDQFTSQYLRTESDEILSPVADSRSRRSAIGTGLVEWLPTFPDAPMSSVLEAREDLAEGRVKYRASVKSLADKLQSAALDDTLPSEIEELWHDEVRPELANLRQTVTASRLARETGSRLATDGFTIPALLVTVASAASLTEVVPTAVGAAGAAGRAAAVGAGEALRARSARKKHDLVYLLDLNKRLGDFGLD